MPRKIAPRKALTPLLGLDDAEDYARSAPREFVLCRTRKHVPDDVLIRDYDLPGGGWGEVSLCLRCKQEMHREYSEAGTPVRSWIVYDDEYLMKGKGRQTREALGAMRLVARQRSLAETARSRPRKERR